MPKHKKGEGIELPSWIFVGAYVQVKCGPKEIPCDAKILNFVNLEDYQVGVSDELLVQVQWVPRGDEDIVDLSQVERMASDRGSRKRKAVELMNLDHSESSSSSSSSSSYSKGSAKQEEDDDEEEVKSNANNSVKLIPRKLQINAHAKSFTSKYLPKNNQGGGIIKGRSRQVRKQQYQQQYNNTLPNFSTNNKKSSSSSFQPVRQYYHSRTYQPMKEGEWDVNSDDDLDEDLQWRHDVSEQMMNEIEGLSKNELQFFQLWNRFIKQDSIVHNKAVPEKCQEFIHAHVVLLNELKLRDQLMLHYMNLYDHSLVSRIHMLEGMNLFDQLSSTTNIHVTEQQLLQEQVAAENDLLDHNDTTISIDAAAQGDDDDDDELPLAMISTTSTATTITASEATDSSSSCTTTTAGKTSSNKKLTSDSSSSANDHETTSCELMSKTIIETCKRTIFG